MASITRRKWTTSGETRTAWTVLDNNRKSAGTYDRKKDAEAKKREIEEKIERGAYVPRGEAKMFKEVAKEFLADKKLSNERKEISTGRRKNLEGVLENHLLPKFAGYRIDQIGVETIQRWLDEEKRNERSAKTGRPYGIRHIEAMLVVLSMIFDFAQRRNRGLARNPIEGWKKKQRNSDPLIRLPSPPETEADFLEVEAAGRLLAWLAKTPRLAGYERLQSYRSSRVGIVISLLAGLRVGEVCGLQWQNVLLDERQLRVKRSLSSHDGLKEPKSKAGRRTVPISRLLLPWLEALWHWRGQPTTGYVILNAWNRPMQAATLGGYYWPRVARAAGIVDDDGAHRCSFHGLRHTAGSRWLADGMTLDDVSEWLGHANTQITKKIYIHRMAHDDRALRSLDQADDRILGMMHQLGVLLPSAPKAYRMPLPALPAPPTIDIAPTSVLITGTVVEHAELLEWQQRAIMLYRRSETIANIAREVRKDNRTTAKFLESAVGYVPPKKPGKYGEAGKAKALEMLAVTDEEGNARYSLAHIANTLGVGESTVHRWNEDSGIARRRALRPGTKPRHVREQALAMYEAKRPIAEIVETLGVGNTSVRRWIETEDRERPTREQALAMWEAGEPAERIAAELGVTDVQVGRWADRAALPARGRGWKSAVASEKHTANLQHEAL